MPHPHLISRVCIGNLSGKGNSDACEHFAIIASPCPILTRFLPPPLSHLKIRLVCLHRKTFSPPCQIAIPYGLGSPQTNLAKRLVCGSQRLICRLLMLDHGVLPCFDDLVLSWIIGSMHPQYSVENKETLGIVCYMISRMVRTLQN